MWLVTEGSKAVKLLSHSRLFILESNLRTEMKLVLALLSVSSGWMHKRIIYCLNLHSEAPYCVPPFVDSVSTWKQNPPCKGRERHLYFLLLSRVGSHTEGCCSCHAQTVGLNNKCLIAAGILDTFSACASGHVADEWHPFWHEQRENAEETKMLNCWFNN